MHDCQEIIDAALAGGRTALSDAEAKELLAFHGVPLVPEITAATATAAAAVAVDTGFPVVLKGWGQTLLHKTEMGLVRLHLNSAEAVQDAAAAMAAAAGSRLEGFIVQPQLAGRREFVAGLVRDPQFGPVVLFGLGGVFTEALADVTLRVAPLSRTDAEAMLTEVRCHRLLSAFRGDDAVDRRQMVDVLMALSEIGCRYPQVSEIDINPILVTPDGRPWAVDAVVTAAQPSAAPSPVPKIAPETLAAIFHPRKIAFVGASGQMGKWGHMLLIHTLSGGFGGQIFLVNPKGGTIAGRPVLRQVGDLPDGVDLAVVTVPARAVADLIPRLQERGIRSVLLISSGFGETGPAGKAQEADLVRRAVEAGILILGPNTMGICNPHIHLHCTGSPVRPEPGSAAMVAQSGNMGVQLLAFAEEQGIGIRAFCGSGNEAMITIEDYLEAFAADELTRTVLLYVESVKNGRRFFENARKLGRIKPIVLLKGGQSEAGRRAAASHTGAMAGDRAVFDAACRQAGVIKVDQPMDLLDLAAAFDSLPLPRGNRVAIMTLGGGWGVITADLCADHALTLPALTGDLISRIDRLLPSYWSRANPIDLVGENDPTIPMTVMADLMAWEGCDAVINLGILGRRIFLRRMAEAVRHCDPDSDPAFLDRVVEMLDRFEEDYIAHCARLMARHGKPILGVSLLTDAAARTVYPVAGQNLRAVFYPTPERAVKALARMVEYAGFRGSGP